MNPKIIFFDLDDTLYFRRDAFYLAFDEYFKGCGFVKSVEFKTHANDTCIKRGDEVFYLAQRGVITQQEMYAYRFQNGFKDVGISLTEKEALDFHAIYKNHLYSLKLNDDVIQMLDFAKENFFALGIITNGPSSHQRNKINNLGLEKWISPELIVVSGEFGIDKPDTRIFEVAAKKAEEYLSAHCDVHREIYFLDVPGGEKVSDAKNLIMIGDSLKNDIEPAQSLGWNTIFLKEDIKQIIEELKRYC
ncbi:HAD family hydrolase [Treponema sp.]|uniref:HAD family hydrolase n=1 Tax=Treponema sp. TaxID=166 RepID=UPI00298DB70B|nr:HAD family hydrolase [Treponema sp.]MCR5612844.1 HAD family hydrolase [Treponema sp.]